MKLKIKPKDNVLVKLPIGEGFLPLDGLEVEWPGPEFYWARRLYSGEIEIVEEKPKKKEKSE